MTQFKFLRGGGEMGAMIRDFDWAATPLGSPGTWPMSLRTLLAIVLTAKQSMYLAWGPDLTMIYNDAYRELLGDKHPQALGSSYRTVWRETWSVVQPLIEQVQDGEPVHMDDIMLFVNRNGRKEEAHFAFSYTPILGDDGSFLGLFCPCRETTDQILAERQLEAAKKAAEDANLAKSMFIANMSHELRTPLSAIIGYSEMLTEELADRGGDAALTDDLRKIENNARHLLGLINDVLDLSKIESGKMEVFPETFDVAEVVRDVATTVSSLIGKKNNTLELHLGDDLGTMHSDITKIRQMLLNLLSNAAKFTEDGVIKLAVKRRPRSAGGDQLVFRVIDSGIGMTQEQLSALFQRFQQADASTTRRFGGTGLGLSITKAFSRMLGGDVEVLSTHGVGSTFTIKLPAEAPEREETVEEDASATEPPVPGRELVLIIDDDPAQCDLMTRFLEREGFCAKTAADGASGLALARQLRPRAILLDVMMPGMDGWSVLSALKADAELVKIPVVMVTFTSERGLAGSLGAADYVSKPVQWERFKQVMDRFRDAAGDVLVVDDDRDARHQIRRALERDGWTVAEAGNGQEALRIVERATPRVVLLDLTMPVMDGFTFLRELRERHDCRDVPVIVLTAMDVSREDRKRLRGANQVLNKGDVSLQALARDLHALTER